MKIDGTRYKAFWESPERYRLTYQCNIVPAQKSFYLDRGISFHTYVDLYTRGHDESFIRDVLTGKTEYQGQVFQLEETPLESGIQLAKAFFHGHKLGNYSVLASELEFDAPIPGSPHSMVGRIDQIIELDGKPWILEFKTATAKKSYDRVEKEWEDDKQADFEMIGAQFMGFDVLGVLVQYVLDTTPPKVWEPLEVRRSVAHLQRTKLAVHQTCETIEMYVSSFGLDQPWPHLPNWKCQGGYCEYKTICQHAGKMTPASCGEGWKKREEHLEILQGDAA